VGIEQGHTFDNGEQGRAVRTLERAGFDVAVPFLDDIGNKGVFTGEAVRTDEQFKELFFHISSV